MFLRGVQRVERGVEDLVEDVVGRGDEAGGDERQYGLEREAFGNLEVEIEYQGDGVAEDDEDVLEPVVDAADFQVFDHLVTLGFFVSSGSGAAQF